MPVYFGLRRSTIVGGGGIGILWLKKTNRIGERTYWYNFV